MEMLPGSVLLDYDWRVVTAGIYIILGRQTDPEVEVISESR